MPSRNDCLYYVVAMKFDLAILRNGRLHFGRGLCPALKTKAASKMMMMSGNIMYLITSTYNMNIDVFIIVFFITSNKMNIDIYLFILSRSTIA